MSPERWEKIRQIYHSVLEVEPGRREAFLKDACAGDESLCDELKSLLGQEGNPQGFFETPALDVVARAFAEGEAQTSHQNLAGQTLLRYRIEERIGVGGMGVVYRARDNHLKRAVAIKVLPDLFAHDSERLARFEREARAVAALSHPNILGIHDLCTADGVNFAVMELLEGETLRQRLEQGPLPVRKAIGYSKQISEGLAAAHEQGIVHRDLKPENVFITQDGRVKILDFGLAKRQRDTQNEASTSLSRPGVLMGTVGYMSPEQLRGHEADMRSDIFAFGAILYEMLSGERAFRGSEAQTISAILKEDLPALSQGNRRIPATLERIVHRCLEKVPAERFQSARDLGFALEAVIADSGAPAQMQQPAVPRWHRRHTMATIAVTVFLIIAGIVYLVTQRGTRYSAESPLIPVPFTTYAGEQLDPSFSPDGNQVAFSWNGPKQDNFDIYIKQVGSESVRRLTNDPHWEGTPAWSPDGQFIAFVRDPENDNAAVMLIPVNGGRERRVTVAADIFSDGLCWHPGGRWLAVSLTATLGNATPGIFLVSSETGEKQRLTTAPGGNALDITPAFSQDGRNLVFARTSGSVSELYLLPISAELRPEREPRQLTFDDKKSLLPAWMPDGEEFIYTSGSKIHDFSLWRLSPFDSDRPQPLPLSAGDSALCPSISGRARRLVYMRHSCKVNLWRYQIPTSAASSELPSMLKSSTRTQETPQYSPDGKSIAYVAWTSGTPEIWVCDNDGTNDSRLTSLGGRAPILPQWSPDGQMIIFSMYTAGKSDLCVVPVHGGGIRQLRRTAFNEDSPAYSLDGRWIFFDSDRDGPRQVWKMSTEGGDPVQVTRNGGSHPRESMDGRTLFYLKPKNPDIDELWKIAVDGGDGSLVLEEVFRANFAASRRGIYYVAPARQKEAFPQIFFYDFASGRQYEVCPVHGEPQWGFTVSPDEQSIVLTQGKLVVRADLMIVENLR